MNCGQIDLEDIQKRAMDMHMNTTLLLQFHLSKFRILYEKVLHSGELLFGARSVDSGRRSGD